ncbi:MAG: deoxyribose-phosphate aldolase [Chitinophagales bacterium]|nr:deoxyribose-phosphate aldolase [Chitinophagales bacterium]MDW8394551.1 deoxyribose-phosphate aldolase [Chitinophagales bacterium]
MNPQELARFFDHTLLKPELTSRQVEALCAEAIQHGFAAVCIPSCYVRSASVLLRGTSVSVATVIGFPFGYGSTKGKRAEAETAMEEGAGELDVVINLSALRSGNWELVESELQQLTQQAHSRKCMIKWIIESGMLTPEELRSCCRIAADAGVDFVKTATGFIGPGATAKQVRTLRSFLPPQIAVKASGGIRTLTQAQELLAAGASRLGTSSAVAILQEAQTAATQP